MEGEIAGRRKNNGRAQTMVSFPKIREAQKFPFTPSEFLPQATQKKLTATAALVSRRPWRSETSVQL